MPGAADAAVTSNRTGTDNGYFYSFWTDGTRGTAAMNLGPGGNYSTTWNNVGDFIAGKGWRTGGRRMVSFQGTFTPSGEAYLLLHGWTRNPLVEYAIVEDHGTYEATGTHLGTLVSDGGTYDVYRKSDIYLSNVDGPSVVHRYWSVRRSTRTSGTITTGNHFDAWARYGMSLGTFQDMTLATEGVGGSGASDITVDGLGTP